MKTSMSWIKSYVPDLDVTPKEYMDAMTLSGTKVEEYTCLDEDLDKIVVGEILSIDKHPDADKLVVCQVNIGSETIQIVTGAPNTFVGAKVVVVLDGGRVACDHSNARVLGGVKIKKGKLRGIESFGMMCSIEELGSSKEIYPDAPDNGIYIINSDCKPGDDALEVLGLRDSVFEYEITSNRVDCYSVIGIAREVAATFNKKLVLPKIDVVGNQEDVNDYLSVEVNDSNLCPRYLAKIVKNVTIKKSPKWLRERLISVGIRPINNIVDITNYVMEEYGQPMHAFDYNNIGGHKIIVKLADKDSKFTTLDGVKRDIDSDVLLINDENHPIALAGIMGGENSMITDDVQTIVFESAVFNGPNIRKSSNRIGLRTDASTKFEKGLDPTNALDAINRACALIEELEAGEVVGGIIDVNNSSKRNIRLAFDDAQINQLLGTNISRDDMIKYLDKVDLKLDTKTNEIIVPEFRQDIHLMADLAEEVARFYGYDNIPTSLPNSGTNMGGLSFKLSVEKMARDIACANGFDEAMSYSFESEKVFDKLLLPSDSIYRKAIEIKNPLGEEFKIMRTLPLNGLLTSLSTNYNRRNKSAKLFELANTYMPHKLPLDELPDERMQFVLGMYNSGDFYDMKAVVEEFLFKIGLKGIISYDNSENIPYLHPGRQASIIYNHTLIGEIGEVHPVVSKNYSIKPRVYIANLSMKEIEEFVSFDYRFKPIPKFPAVSRDLSLLLDDNIPVRTIEDIFRDNGGANLESFNLFDIYKGEQIDSSKKSVSYSLVFRNPDKTLEDSDIEPIISKIISKLSDNNITLRD